MQVQDQAVFDWVDAGGLEAASVDEALARDFDIQKRVMEITRAQPASLWIARAMRAVPMLRQIRVESRERVADRLFAAMRPRLKNATDDELRRAIRLNIELSSAAIEMMLEEPDEKTDDMIREFSWMMLLYFQRFV